MAVAFELLKFVPRLSQPFQILQGLSDYRYQIAQKYKEGDERQGKLPGIFPDDGTRRIRSNGHPRLQPAQHCGLLPFRCDLLTPPLVTPFKNVHS
ncbi:hypothetical protein [Polaromonas aquatica]|uniref:hypothetical protein n=1 Tax=Polaromonas aquatica TaxID=332657 RepID=UPI003D66289E